MAKKHHQKQCVFNAFANGLRTQSGMRSVIYSPSRKKLVEKLPTLLPGGMWRAPCAVTTYVSRKHLLLQLCCSTVENEIPLLASLIIPGLQHGVKKGRHVGFIFTVILTMKGHFCWNQLQCMNHVGFIFTVTLTMNYRTLVLKSVPYLYIYICVFLFLI